MNLQLMEQDGETCIKDMDTGDMLECYAERMDAQARMDEMMQMGMKSAMSDCIREHAMEHMAAGKTEEQAYAIAYSECGETKSADELELTDGLRVKAVLGGDEWELDVLSAPYGGHINGKDAHGEYFSPRTNFYENDGAPLPLVFYYHGYTPDGKPQGD